MRAAASAKAAPPSLIARPMPFGLCSGLAGIAMSVEWRDDGISFSLMAKVGWIVRIA